MVRPQSTSSSASIPTQSPSIASSTSPKRQRTLSLPATVPSSPNSRNGNATSSGTCTCMLTAGGFVESNERREEASVPSPRRP